MLRRWHMDVPLLLLLAVIILVGFFVLYSATGEDVARLHRQNIRMGLALLVMFIIAQISPSTLYRWSPNLYIAGVLLLISVLFFGEVGKGAQRWLNLGFVRFQPSELIKISVPMMIAWYFADRRLPPRFLNLLSAGILIVIPVLLVAKQPDLGTSILIASAGFFVVFLAGLSWRILSGIFIASVLMAYPIWIYLMHDYQRERVLTFLNPENDPLGSGYHIIQSMIAIGSGGVFGKGWLNGTQSQLDFLPERTTDFIFAVYSEEFGLIGNVLLLALYALVILRGLYIATQAQDTYARLLAGSLSLSFFVYVFVNTGMVTGLLPVVGLPLPLISYGGTSMVTLMAGFGILMSIQTHRKLLSP